MNNIVEMIDNFLDEHPSREAFSRREVIDFLLELRFSTTKEETEELITA